MLDRRQLGVGALGLAFAGAARAADSGGAIEVPIHLNRNRILVDATLNGRGPYPLIIDTGAQVSGVRLRLAQELGLQQRGSAPANNGVFPVYVLKELVFGGVLRQAGVALLGLTLGATGGDGLLAAGLLTSLDSDLDFDRSLWRIYPAGAPARPGFEAVPSRTVSNTGVEGLSRRIYVDMTLNGAPIQPLMDTGAATTLVLDNATGRRLGLWNATTPYALTRTAGIDGPARSPSRVVRAHEIRLGSKVWSEVLVLIHAADADTPDPIVGLSLIRTLNLAFDRRTAALKVQPNGQGMEPVSYSPSGVWIDAVNGVLSVREVGTGSPAGAAGVRAGDVLVETTDLRAVVRQLTTSGAPVALKLRRGGTTLEASFTPRPYL